MNKVNLNSIADSCAEDHIFSARFFILMLLTLLLLLPLASHADGLFDFQMKLATSGNVEAQYKVGEMYETGFGVKQDQKEAMNWITKAAGQGHETASFKLLYWDAQKNGLKGENKAKVDELKKKAKADNPQAQYFVGKMLADGVGLKKNTDKAITWLSKAALAGVTAAEGDLITLREEQQRELQAKKLRQEKKQAELRAKQKREQQAKLEQKKKLEAQNRAKAEAKARADAKAKANAQVDAKAKAEAKAKADALANEKKAAAEAEALEKANKQKSYEAKVAAKKAAEAKTQLAKKQASLKKAKERKQGKAKFESDPCNGKSAKFLSTCK